MLVYAVPFILLLAQIDCLLLFFIGNVYAGENLYIGPDVTIGKIGRIKSALSRVNIIIAEGAVIYGYAGCENSGETIKAKDFVEKVNSLTDIKIDNKNIVKNKKADEFEYIKCNISKDGYLNLDNLELYEKIDYYAFRECDNLETIIIPDSVEKIKRYAFFGCKNLKNVVIGENSRLEQIGDYAFGKCEKLEKIRLISVGEIGYAAFWEAAVLKEVEISNEFGLKECASNSFQNCDKFDSVKFFENLNLCKK